MTARVGALPRIRMLTHWVAAATLFCGLGACTLAAGDRIGPGRDRTDEIRIGVPHAPLSFDPALARSAVERVVARALFATLVTIDGEGALRPGLAHRWEWDEHASVLRLLLDDEARFSDGTRLTAHDVVWSWHRALRATTRAVDKSAFDAFADGRELVAGVLLRASDSRPLQPTPYSVFAPGAAPVPPALTERLEPGARVRVLDSNARRPCCGEAVPMLVATSDGEQAVASLEPSDIARVLAARVVDGSTWLRLRDPNGNAGWVRSASVSVVVPPVAVRRVVDRGEGSLVLRSGPDPDAPVRDELRDDDTVELLERGPDFSLVLDERSGRAAFLRSDVIDEVLGERWWLEVVDSARPSVRGWVNAGDLVFDPSLLRARAIDASTLELDVASDSSLDGVLRALAEPVLAPVPARLVDELGNAWATPTHLVSSGAFTLGTVTANAVHLLRRHGDGPARVLLVVEADRTAALHAYRAGDLDVLMDGLLPVDLVPTLRRAADFVEGPRGGALCNAEVRGFSVAGLDLNRLEVSSVVMP